MIIGIIGAMDEEVSSLLDILKNKTIRNKASMVFYSGELWNKEVVIVKSGIGKVNAAICTQILIDDYNASLIINVGVAGGINSGLFPGDVVIAEDLIQHDMDTSAFGDKIGQIPRLDTYEFKCDTRLVNIAKQACEKITEYHHYVGRIVTGDQFIANLEKIGWLEDNFNAMACEMEGGSIAQVSYLNKIPFVVIRSISDNANNGAKVDFEKFIDIAVNNSIKLLEAMFQLI